jgi:hypothetical protein
MGKADSIANKKYITYAVRNYVAIETHKTHPVFVKICISKNVMYYDQI